jgi:hypothetical protein
MNELDKIKTKSKSFSKIIILEFAYCSLTYCLYKIFPFKGHILYWIYIFILVAIPVTFNTYLYLNYKKKADFLQANNILIIQILLLIFTFKFLI